jgi:ferredoxin-NADP reductase
VRWLVATVAETVPETARAVTLRLDVPDWPGHRAGQHVDVRLTAEDGYSAQRSYSIASPPGSERLELTVERIDDGEVSPYLTTVADVGDQFELRGPIGGWFVWDGDGTDTADTADTAPVLLVGGGSGVVPLRAILRHHASSGSAAAMHLVYSARTLGDVIYREELEALVGPRRAVTLTLTQESAPGWAGHRGRLDAGLLAEVGWPPSVQPHCYVCGPTGFVEVAANALVALGHEPARIRTERFGPTGG